jgi:hypothetical protein
MKVICIDGVNKGELPFDDNGRIASKSDEIYEGEIYTVVGEYPTSAGLAYFLEERRKNAAYAASCFIPLSDKDETEENVFVYQTDIKLKEGNGFKNFHI